MPDKHLSSQFDSEMNAVSSRVMELGGLVESQLRHAMYALAQFSPESAAKVVEIESEEAGARDALTGAFEELKKFEHVAETTRLNKLIAAAKRETAAFDEMGLRRRAEG